MWISQSLSTQGLNDGQGIYFPSLHYAQRCISLPNSQGDMAHKLTVTMN
jgi:hypothetical protein